jgi:hypothetical protein
MMVRVDPPYFSPTQKYPLIIYFLAFKNIPKPTIQREPKIYTSENSTKSREASLGHIVPIFKNIFHSHFLPTRSKIPS